MKKKKLYLMNTKKFFVIWLIIFNLLQGLLLVQSRKSEDNLKSFEIDENLLKKRCELVCYRENREHFGKCTVQACINDITQLSKPGGCPYNAETENDDGCFEDCQTLDYECPDVKKCCKRKCGWSCQEPIGLEYDTRLPPIPSNITLIEGHRKGKIVDLSWQMPLNRTQRQHTYFVVEFRSHIGSVFVERKLGHWQWITFHKIAEEKSHTSYTKTIHANVKLRTGRWYQFRVAAINEFGFQGYSNISQPFRLSNKNKIAVPKPPKPVKNLSMTPIRLLKNGTIHTRVSWNAPKSDLPIEKYRISWALYLKAENDSLLLNDAYVREPSRHYDFWDLAINSLYYIQVQAISIIGKKRLKSTKESLMLNTTVPVTNMPSSSSSFHSSSSLTLSSSLSNSSPEHGVTKKIDLQISSKIHLPEIIVKFIANKKLGMIVRILWDEYYRGSLLELCTGSVDCETKEYDAVKPKKDHIDFGKLKYNTQYTVRIINPNTMSTDDEVLKTKTFNTPTCLGWKKKFPNLSINC